MSYVDELDSLPPFTGSGEFTLDPMLRLLAAAGNPHLKLPRVIHVTGTNGKGSVVAHACELLEGVGLKTAAFTSPHAPPDYRNHLAVRMQPVDETLFADAVFNLKAALSEHPTAAPPSEEAPHLAHLRQLGAIVLGAETDIPPSQFEFITAACLLATARLYAAGKVDVLILEVGLGGRVDCTNVIPPPACAAFTSIHRDHCGILGATPEAIAREKSGIIKPGTQHVVSYPQESSVDAVLRTTAADCGITQVEVAAAEAAGAGVGPGVAPHQVLNFRVAQRAVEAVLRSGSPALPEGFAVPAALEAVRQAPFSPLSPASLLSSGRFEVWRAPGAAPAERLDVVFDGAHNPQAVEGLRDVFEKAYGMGGGDAAPEGVEGLAGCVVVVGVMKDKDTASLAATYRSLLEGRAEFYPVTLPPPRGLAAGELAEGLVKAGLPKAQVHCAGDSAKVQEVVRAAASAATRGASPLPRALLITGSFYLLAAAREVLAPGILANMQRVR